MSVDLNSREVLKYLNQLGYYNINGEQLKEFIKDLKTLIKYDEKQKKRVGEQNKENVHFTQMRQCSSVESETECDHYLLNDHNRRRKEECLGNIANTLYSSSTLSSQAKVVPKKVEVHKVNKKKPVSIRSAPSSDSNIFSSRTSTCQEYCKPHASEIQSGKTRSGTTKSLTSRRADELRPKVSFIRPRQPIKTCKSDPVAMYHQYQEEWKRQKIPGENKHFDLRWAVRERMLGDVHSQNN